MSTKSAPSASIEAPQTEDAREAEDDPAVERVLNRVDLTHPKETTEHAALNVGASSRGPRLRTARIARIDAGHVYLKLRGATAEVEGDVDDDVDIELIRRSLAQNEAVLIEEEEGLAPVIVGVVQTHIPDTLELRARKVIIEGDDEVIVRSGTGAMRLRQDGDVEIVGSRISTVSRGLFRLVGRMLRLN